jgi:hypothetical protein
MGLVFSAGLVAEGTALAPSFCEYSLSSEYGPAQWRGRPSISNVTYAMAKPRELKAELSRSQTPTKEADASHQETVTAESDHATLKRFTFTFSHRSYTVCIHKQSSLCQVECARQRTLGELVPGPSTRSVGVRDAGGARACGRVRLSNAADGVLVRSQVGVALSS